MTYSPRQRDIVFIDFDPSKGYEIKKRRPALVLSRNEYNVSTNMVIVCPITSTDKDHPFLVKITSEKLPSKSTSKVNTNQVYSLDYSERAKRNIQFVENMEEEQFYRIAQKFMHNFAFKF
ncbi:type II toxin-antitoxin system PemK/MazF family toxin [Alkalibacterium putridalgicola]|uniref:type II toxin-antitoxin system PemK/MazF family toxin n=1 Tax=Alkalibacterium putridalgicola TaxID=426703 RepID=UPI0034D005F9